MTTEKELEVNRGAFDFERAALESVLSRRFFYTQSFEIYGGVTGFYDYGPPMTALQNNVLDTWRKHFVIEEEMLEVDTTIMTLADVLKTSGHVDRFTDWMVKDKGTGDIFRADHLVEGVLEARLKGDKEARGVELKPEVTDPKAKKKKVIKSAAMKLDDTVLAEYENVLAQIDNYQGPALGELMRKYNIKSPDTGNELTEPVEFNLMFDSSIGPTGHIKGYLRPETAQGHFINFARLLDYNNGKLPFASAQIGKSFRNEISPRQGLLRVREFVMGEIEHYVDPKDKRHIKFSEVKEYKLHLLPKDVQSAGKTDLMEISIGEAVSKGIVDNETLGYFIVRIHQFLVRIGIDPHRLRFRQHMSNEMAHYAADCWDAEIQSSYGWIECVGCADRSAYDLTVHSVRTGTKLVVRDQLPEPVIEERWHPELDKKKLGPLFKKDAGVLEKLVAAFDQERLACVATELSQKGSSEVQGPDGKTFELTNDLITVTRKTFKETGTVIVFSQLIKLTQEHGSPRVYPNVIEPSFGIGRILYSLLEHSFWRREQDIQRAVLSLPPVVAPVKCLIVPLSSHESFRPLIQQISRRLRRSGVSCKVDDSSVGIGKKYSRNDEIGIPFGITVDFASVKNGTLTLRERDTTLQRIGSLDEVLDMVVSLSENTATWKDACDKLATYDKVQDV